MKKSLFALLLLALTADFFVHFPARVSAGPAEDVQAAMQLLKSKAATLGAPNVKGEEAVAGKTVPALHFGATKMNNNFVLVDEVQKEVGGTATIFVKSGDEFVRVATNVKKDDGSRAIGTILDPKGKAIAAIAKGESYFGEADILGKPYVTGYEPATITRRLPPDSQSQCEAQRNRWVSSEALPPRPPRPFSWYCRPRRR
jgi:hypothetical protein